MPLVLTGAGAITGLTSVPSSGLQLADANMPTGSVLQVVNATLGPSTVTTSSATRSNTGLSASITPISASSKILVSVSMVGCEKATNGYLAFWLMRDSTDLLSFEGQGGYAATSSTNSFGSCSTTYLDSPSTTSATTYKVQFSSVGAGGQVGFNNSNSTSTITLMEIAA